MEGGVAAKYVSLRTQWERLLCGIYDKVRSTDPFTTDLLTDLPDYKNSKFRALNRELVNKKKYVEKAGRHAYRLNQDGIDKAFELISRLAQ